MDKESAILSESLGLVWKPSETDPAIWNGESSELFVSYSAPYFVVSSKNHPKLQGLYMTGGTLEQALASLHSTQGTLWNH